MLVVDDNIDAADLVAEFMAFQGYEIAVAYGGEEAIKIAETFGPNLIFLDLGMPGMDGYQVVSALRHAEWFPPTRIVALTAWGDQDSRERTKTGGFDAHLVKPARLENLIAQAQLL
ncbi:response regulator [Massilia sp. 9096]|uniref:response regulator n=1 Tax=Massilia sp. 9096 TaxID=1500894 RepID=UPI000A7A691B|nr:response regulator [Massilia sp. 9096]